MMKTGGWFANINQSIINQSSIIYLLIKMYEIHKYNASRTARLTGALTAALKMIKKLYIYKKKLKYTVNKCK